MNLKFVLENINVKLISGEKLIKATELLSFLNNNEVELNVCTFTPFYVIDEKRLELYEYELILCETQLTENDITQSKKSNISANLLGSSNKKSVNKLKQYIFELLNNEKMHNEVKSYIGSFNKDNLYFAIY